MLLNYAEATHDSNSWLGRQLVYRQILFLLSFGLTLVVAPSSHAQKKPPIPFDGIYEGETHFLRQGTARVQRMTNYGRQWSDDHHLLWDGRPGDSVTLVFAIDRAADYHLWMQLTKAGDYGAFRVLLNDKPLVRRVDLFSPRVELARLLDLGKRHLKPGQHRLKFELLGANPAAKFFRKDRYLLGLDYLRVVDPRAMARRAQRSRKAGSRTAVFRDVQPLLRTYCYECHGHGKIKGELNLKSFTSKQHFLDDIETTRKVVEALAVREMPPKKAKQPAPEIRQRLAEQLQTWLDDHLQKSKVLQATTMRRLNRYEYNNAVRDLLRLKGDIYPLPERTIRAGKPYFQPALGRFPSSIRVGNRTLGKFQVERQILTGVVPFAIDLQAEHGFNNRGDELSLSPILLEAYLKLGQSIVNSPEFASYCRDYNALFGQPVASGDKQNAKTRRRALQKAAQARISGLLRRAFRQPLDSVTESRYHQFFASEFRRTQSFETSMKNVVSAILASPRFLYLAEAKAMDESQTRVSDFELATRLSFFLWSTLPDQRLLDLAKNKKLREAGVLESEVRRMLNDPRARALSENFARQWLRLDQLITAVPDPKRFPTYYSRIGCEYWKFGLQTMIEPLLLFESVMVEDRSILTLIDSNYTYRSDELQHWYESEKPFSNKGESGRFNTNQQLFVRRKLSNRRQGGVITTAAVMTMTSSPLRTSPIVRGSWVATVIFNRPPAPPPDTVPEIEADDAEIEAKGLTLRQRLKQHQVNQTCASCHAKIDPLGFALENFDAVGRWRKTYRSGLHIDSSGKLFGELEFKDVVSFKDALLKRPEHFVRAFSEHLLSYALGRQLHVTDKLAIDRIVRRVQADGNRFSTIVVEITQSYPFLHKTNQQRSASVKHPTSRSAK